MKKELGEFTGKTVEDALAAAVAATGVPAEKMEMEVLEKGKVTFLGIGSVKARIKVYVQDDATDGERAVEFLEGLLKLLSVDAAPHLVREEEKIEIDLETEDSHAVIGKRGAVLDALQSLAGAVANTGREEYKRVVVDCGNYREKREETLRRVAKKTAEKAVRQGRKISLEPMSAYERRVIHSTLADSTEVRTSSEGKDPRRYVVVTPNELKPYYRDRRPQGGRGDFRRSGKGSSRGNFNRGEYNNNRDYNRGEYNNREYNRGDRRRGEDRDRNRGGFRRDFSRPQRRYTEEEKAERSRMSGGTGMGSASSEQPAYKKSSSMVFGTFLGNSRKDENLNSVPEEKTEE